MDSTISGRDQESNRAGRLADALDACLARIKAGATRAEALADHPELAAELAPLLAQAERVASERVSPAPAPTGLAMGRSRFLEAANRARAAAPAAAAGAADLDDPRVTDALDSALDRVRAGEPSERAVAAFPALLPALAPLLATAGEVVAGRVSAPPPPRGLNPGRARFLAVAAELRAERAAAPVGLLAGLAALLGLGGPAVGRPARRMAMASLAVLACLFLGTGVVTTAAAEALPGDVLYPIKRLGEQVRLAISLDPASRTTVEIDLSRERAEELAGLVALGRPATLSWDASFLRLEPLGTGAVLVVAPLGEAPSGEQRLAWTAETRADLGPLPADSEPLAVLATLAPGTRLYLEVTSVAGGTPTLVFLRVSGPLPATLVEAPEQPVQRVAPLPAQQETATPEPGQTASPTAPVSPTPPATLPPTIAPTVAPTLTPAPTAGAPGEDDQGEPEVMLIGILVDKGDGLEWRVADGGQGSRIVLVDVRGLSDADRAAVKPGDSVRLAGHWTSREAGRFAATRLPGYSTPGACTEGVFFNETIASATMDIVILEGNPLEYWLVPSTQVNVALQPGTAVDGTYKRCDGGRTELLSIGPASQEEALEAGLVVDLDEANRTFRLTETDSGPEVTVRYSADTPITKDGQPAALKNGQRLEVRGHLDPGDPTVIIATSIRIEQDVAGAAEAPQPGGEPTALPMPTASLPPDGPTALPPDRSE
jgi:hypothetical protein